jgi:hypothetical protein
LSIMPWARGGIVDSRIVKAVCNCFAFFFSN